MGFPFDDEARFTAIELRLTALEAKPANWEQGKWLLDALEGFDRRLYRLEAKQPSGGIGGAFMQDEPDVLRAKPHAPGCSTGDPCWMCQKQEEPQACPFCNTEATISSVNEYFWFKCRLGVCRTEGPCRKTRAEAIRDWNRITVKP